MKFKKQNISDEIDMINDYIEYKMFKSVMNQNKNICLLYTSPSPRDRTRSRMPSSACTGRRSSSCTREDPLLAPVEDLFLAQEEGPLLVQEEDLVLMQQKDFLLV